MNRKQALALALLGALLIALCCGFIATRDRDVQVRFDLQNNAKTMDDYVIEMDPEGVIEVTDRQMKDGGLALTVSPLEPGNALLFVTPKDGSISQSRALYVHKSGIITQDNFFGSYNGDRVVPIAALVFLAALLAIIVWNYRNDVRYNLYQYKNVRNLGLIIFLAFVLFSVVTSLATYRGLTDSFTSSLDAMTGLSFIVLPVAFLLSILVTVSNIELLRKEGRTWRNLLGTFLGLLFIVGTLFPFLLGEFLQRSTVFDVHNENGLALYVEWFVENAILVVVTYLELMLLATIILAVRAARRIPKFDKDYILILGCKILKDGSLPKLLQSRADRAVEFAKMQKEATGKDIVFVPSGGKGSDEVISEADAVANHLRSLGIPEEQILVENESANTYENFGNSLELIRAHSEKPDPKIAFSTTNYHVFRSGMYATKQGILAEGIGAPTKRYYWINAFIREFIATIRYEWKAHLTVILLALAAILVPIVMLYLNNNL